MTINMMNSEEQLTSQPEERVKPEAIRALNRANGNRALVRSLLHEETRKGASKMIILKKPMCLIKSENSIIHSRYTKILLDDIAYKK